MDLNDAVATCLVEAKAVKALGQDGTAAFINAPDWQTRAELVLASLASMQSAAEERDERLRALELELARIKVDLRQAESSAEATRRAWKGCREEFDELRVEKDAVIESLEKRLPTAQDCQVLEAVAGLSLEVLRRLAVGLDRQDPTSVFIAVELNRRIVLADLDVPHYRSQAAMSEIPIDALFAEYDAAVAARANPKGLCRGAQSSVS